MDHPAVNALVPFVHVASVDDSLTFYAHLGFSTDSRLADQSNRAFWASAVSGKAKIMFAQSSGEINPDDQAVLFYMYAENVKALRTHLLAKGLHDGGAFCGLPGPNNGRRVVFEVAYQHYMPAGEIRVADPDGYCILVGQLS